MAKHKEQQEKQHSASPIFYDRLNRWFEQHSLQWLIAVLVVAIVAGILQFDVKPSDGGDDTSYVLEAMRIVTSGKIAMGFRPPGYILFLSIFVKMFGTNLVLLKLSSFACFLGLIGVMYAAFRKRIEPVILHTALLLVAINPPMHKYAHATWSELTFGLFLMGSIYCLFKMNERNDWKWAALAGIVSMLGFYIRIAGVSLVIAAGIFFLLQRRWKLVLVYGAVCILMLSPLKVLEWYTGTKSFNQASMLSLKNPFQVSEGKETVEGFVSRYVDNAINHLNYQIPDVLSFSVVSVAPEENAPANGAVLPNAAAFVCLLISAVVLVGYVVPVVKQPASPFALIGIFVPIYISFICLALQQVFATIRMLVPIAPFLILGFLQGALTLGNGLRNASKSEALPRGKKFVLIFAALLLLLSGIKTEGLAEANYPVLKANLAGNEFAGVTPDWENYFRASRWIKANLPLQTTGIVCRKPELFLLYAGDYNVYGVYRIEQEHPDSIVAFWRQHHMTHLLYDDFQWSATLRRYVQPVAQKYPSMFELIHQEGGTEQNPSYVFRLNYAVYDAMHQTAAQTFGKK